MHWLFQRGQNTLCFSLVILLASLLIAACAPATAQGSTQTGGRVLSVVSTEDTWGSIVAQLGGKHVQVDSVISSPTVDPHDYESTTTDARNFAQANYVIINGAGYDDWGQKLLDGNPNSSRKVLNVANYLNKKPGDNPHFWEDPDYVQQVANKITSDLQSMDKADSAYFTQQRQAFQTAIQPYINVAKTIQTKYAHTPIGASEALYVYQANYLHLNLVTPLAYLNAENNGTEIPASAASTFYQQISQKQIKVMMLDVQNESNETRNLATLVQKQQIPIVKITETLSPAGTTFQNWQYTQVHQLLQALQQ
jgi:zinc/manganese transport system substrate-binding protein